MLDISGTITVLRPEGLKLWIREKFDLYHCQFIAQSKASEESNLHGFVESAHLVCVCDGFRLTLLLFY